MLSEKTNQWLVMEIQNAVIEVERAYKFMNEANNEGDYHNLSKNRAKAVIYRNDIAAEILRRMDRRE